LLVYVSTNPSQLHVFKTGQNRTDHIPLDFVPISVSISPDGNFAAVGHDAHVSYVDLAKKVVVGKFDVSCKALDIVLANNKWVYVFPERDQWTTIRCIELATGKERMSDGHPSLWAGSLAKLHPSGKFIYVTNNGVSPSDIEKYDIQQGTAVRMYDSPYHGDYPIEGNLWFTEDGNRVFVRGQTTLKVSEDKSGDMIYTGTIGLDTVRNAYAPYNRIVALDHSLATNKLYVITTDTTYRNKPNLPYIWFFDATNLSFQKKIPVKKVDGGVLSGAKIEPYFVFANSNGTKLFVITREQESVGVYKWAIQIL
jgi:hypothetical protein